MEKSAGQDALNKYRCFYEHLVIVNLNDGTIIEGGYDDEFYEDGAILISVIGDGVRIIQSSDRQKMERHRKIDRQRAFIGRSSMWFDLLFDWAG